MIQFDYKEGKAVVIRSLPQLARQTFNTGHITKLIYRNESDTVDVVINGLRLCIGEWRQISMDNPGAHVDVDAINIEFYEAGTNNIVTTGMELSIVVGRIHNLREVKI